ncbi:MAG: hypothetical protein COC12_03105 [Rhodobacteraceae bacterium]|nr:MAG: hypothetical protein COC12_03105 [Paracoccaceae bacterium]
MCSTQPTLHARPPDRAKPRRNATFERIIAINVTCTQNVTDTLVNRIADGGRIILTSSIRARMVVAGFSAYVASKQANVGLMRA